MTLGSEPDIAFARAMNYSIDKDDFWQLSYATDTAGGGVPTEEQGSPSDFFDQFVVMEGGDPTSSPVESFFVPLRGEQGVEDGVSPPTSSIAEPITSTSSNRGSVDFSYTTSNPPIEELTASAKVQRHKTRPSWVTGVHSNTHSKNDPSMHHIVLGHLNPDTIEQRRRLLNGRRGHDQPSGSSISDSELLKLEGLSVNSPRGLVPQIAPYSTSTPPLLQAFAPAATSGNITVAADDLNLSKTGSSNNKAAGRFETIYSTIRRAVGGHSRGRMPQHPNTTPTPQTMTPSYMESAKKATRRLISEGQTVVWDSLPVSPPMTDMANPQSTDFVAGYLDDPFFDPSVPFHHDGALIPAAHINGKDVVYNEYAGPHTPLHTPNMKFDTNGDGMAQYFPATNEPWGLDGTTFAAASEMNGASFLCADPWASFDPSSDSGSNLDFTMGSSSSNVERASSQNHLNLTIQVPSYASDHYGQTPGTGPDDLASDGLMIHMPQPQTPTTAPLLSAQIHQRMSSSSSASAYYPEQTPQGGHPSHAAMHSFRNAYTEHHRRPRPRAPSSGARYHMGPASASPRKARQPASYSSSPSPTPAGGGGRRSRSEARRSISIHRSASSAGGGDFPTATITTDAQSHAIRKRRSAGNWRGQRRTTSGASSDSSGLGFGSNAGAEMGFVNFTPSDHDMLMTGVAPSGSSKTKMRREKEAAERQRQLSEVMVKVVAAAGVDVNRLKEEGIVISP